MAKSKGENVCCVLTLPLLTEPWQDKIIETRFNIMEKFKNTLIRHELNKLKQLERTRAWKRLMKAIRECVDEKARKVLFKERQRMLNQVGISEFGFSNDTTAIGIHKHFAEHIASTFVQRASSDVWMSFEKMLYGKGRAVHFHKCGTLDSIANRYARDGMMIDGDVLTWKGGRCENSITLKIRIRRPKNAYELEMLQKPIKNMRIVRKWIKTRYKYYLQITLGGEPASKCRTIGKGRVGIDIGTQTIAWSSASEVRLAELAAGVKRFEAEKTSLQRKMDRSRRAMNPQNYNPDGTIRRGIKLRWTESNRYRRMKYRLRDLERKNADIRKQEHARMANHILSLGNEIYIENMDWLSLSRRAKETKKDKNGRYARKKRFGKSVANRAPGMLMTLLEQKCKAVGGEYHEVNKTTFKASQYDHISDTFQKKSLGKRWNALNGTDRIQRDLYSAFLLMNSDETLVKTHRARCFETYGQFKIMHDAEMERIRHEDKKHLSSMGVA